MGTLTYQDAILIKQALNAASLVHDMDKPCRLLEDDELARLTSLVDGLTLQSKDCRHEGETWRWEWPMSSCPGCGATDVREATAALADRREGL